MLELALPCILTRPILSPRLTPCVIPGGRGHCHREEGAFPNGSFLPSVCLILGVGEAEAKAKAESKKK